MSGLAIAIPIANDRTPMVRDMTATARGYRAIDWTTSRIAERAGLATAAQREDRANYYEARAAMCLTLAETKLAMVEWAGLNMLAANIMRSERVG